MSTLIIIPARIASSRLPNKMLADIAGKSLIVRTYESAKLSNVGDVVVACDCREIADKITQIGGTAILTDPDLASGTDRIYAAYKQLSNAKKYKYIINVQGDMPFIDGQFIRDAKEIVKKSDCDISTLATPITDSSYMLDSVVKPVIAFESENTGKALYFSRLAVPFGGPFYKHVGIYCFKVAALEKFVSLPQSLLEKTEKLEQLRALENNMTIGITVIQKTSPISVDTKHDLQLARKYYETTKIN